LETALNRNRKILAGLLAFQGDYQAHGRILKQLGIEIREVRNPDDLTDCSHLVIPGGESTTFLKLIEFMDISDAIRSHAEKEKPILATCAGLILISNSVTGNSQKSLSILDASVERNAYGTQINSFETDLDILALGEKPFHGVFIRAPKIISTGKNVEILALHDGNPVLIRENNIIGATFHPELSGDTRLHEWFISLG